MAIGDQANVVVRLQALTPPWFGSSNPILTAIQKGVAWALSTVYGQYAYAALQSRIATATDGFLDLIAWDFFGPNLQRLASEADASFRARILANVLHPGATRAAMTTVLQSLTGHAPRIFEPARPTDTGAYGVGYAGYGVAGGYTNPALIPMQALVTVYRGNGVPDAQLYAAVDAVKPAATEIWTALSN